MTRKRPLWWIKLTTYEYWTWWVFYLPLLPYWLYLAVRTRSLTFFTNADPCIEYGGFFGESKMAILKQIAPEFLPQTLFVPEGTSLNDLLAWLENKQMDFPLIAKPNVGERGTQVEKLVSFADLQRYHQQNPADFIIQEYVDYEIELGVLYYRMPQSEQGQVSSVTRKEFLSIVGDGKSSVEELMEESTRARFQLESMRKRLGNGMKHVYPKGEKVLLEPIGNHCRGTKFINANGLINNTLHQIFNKIALPIEGFHYGRFDMRVRSLEDLYAGKNIRIMELNGVSSEPGHIYDPSFTLFKAYRDLAHHWRIIADISIQQRQRGFQPVPARVLWQVVKAHFSQ